MERLAARDTAGALDTLARLYANGKDVVIIVPTVDLSGNHMETFAYGAKIRFTFSGNVCHVFDKGGKNLEF